MMIAVVTPTMVAINAISDKIVLRFILKSSLKLSYFWLTAFLFSIISYSGKNNNAACGDFLKKLQVV